MIEHPGRVSYEEAYEGMIGTLIADEDLSSAHDVFRASTIDGTAGEDEAEHCGLVAERHYYEEDVVVENGPSPSWFRGTQVICIKAEGGTANSIAL